MLFSGIFLNLKIANAIGTITYDVGTNTITATGGTSGAPIGFIDLYNADISGGWGVVQKINSQMYTITAMLNIGDGSTSTYFASELEQIKAENYSYLTDSYWCRIKNNAHLRFGRVISYIDKTTYRGSSLGCRIYNSTYEWYHKHFLATETGSFLEIYSSHIWAGYPRYLIEGTGKLTIWNSLLTDRCTFGNYFTSDSEIFNTILTYPDNYGFNGISNKVSILYSGFCDIYKSGSTNIEMRNLFIHGTYPTIPTVRFYASSGNLTMIDIQTDRWDCFFYSGSGSSTGLILREYTFNLKLIDENGTIVQGANIEISDINGVVFSGISNSSGQVSTELLRGYYSNATTINNLGVLQDLAPFTLHIDSNNSTLLDYDMIFNLEKPLDLEIALTSIYNETITEMSYSFIVLFLIVICAIGCVILYYIMEKKKGN